MNKNRIQYAIFTDGSAHRFYVYVFPNDWLLEDFSLHLKKEQGLILISTGEFEISTYDGEHMVECFSNGNGHLAPPLLELSQNILHDFLFVGKSLIRPIEYWEIINQHSHDCGLRVNISVEYIGDEKE